MAKPLSITVTLDQPKPRPPFTPAAQIDMEKIIGDVLRDSPEIIALDARVAGQIPRTFTKPWVRVTQLDATNVSDSDDIEHLMSYLIQLDCYAGSDPQIGQAEASALARAVRGVLFSCKDSVVDAVISTVTFRNHARIPDLSFDPPRERFVLDAEVFAHG